MLVTLRLNRGTFKRRVWMCKMARLMVREKGKVLKCGSALAKLYSVSARDPAFIRHQIPHFIFQGTFWYFIVEPGKSVSCIFCNFPI
jgi:hypothetical protein